MLDFKSDQEFQHHLATSIADDVVGDYERTVKELIKSRKILNILTGMCSVLILVISLGSGIMGIVDVDPVLNKMAAILTLTIGAIERFKVYSSQKYANQTSQLSRLIKKSGLKTFGVYSDTDVSRTDRSSQTDPA